MQFLESRTSKAWRWLALFLLSGSAMAHADLWASKTQPVQVLRYAAIAHDHPASASKPQAVQLSDLLRQLLWLRNHHVHFVSLAQLEQALAHHQRLPSHPVLLCFDEPATSLMLPLLSTLQVLRAPALVGMSASRHETDARSLQMRRKFFADPLITLGSEGRHLNRKLPVDPQGDLGWAATTRAWQHKHYEDEPTYRSRIKKSLWSAVPILQQQLHRRPQVMLWPGGVYNAWGLEQAESAGLLWSVGVAQGDASDYRQHVLAQTWVLPGQAPWDIGQAVLHPDIREHAVRLMHINLDYVYDPDPQQEAHNLEHLLQRVRASDVNTVYLQAFADPDGNGAADAVYFPNRYLPVRQDLFAHVLAALHEKTQVRHVFAWMPLLAWQLPAQNPIAQDLVVTLPSHPGYVSNAYPRLSPFSVRAQALIEDMYADLSHHSDIDGILFHDDMTLSDYEDDSSFAHQTYKKWGLPAQVALIRAQPAALQRWSFLKTRYLDHLALRMAAILRQDHPQLLTARNMYAQVVLHPAAEAWYGQSLDSSIASFDQTAIEAMPFMEKAPYHAGFYRELYERIRTIPQGLQKTIFELQAKDWQHGGTPLPTPILVNTICMLFDLGVINVGYIPDDPFKNSPDIDMLRPALEHHCAAAQSYSRAQ